MVVVERKGRQPVVVVVAEYTVAVGNEDAVVDLLRRWAPMARAEEGCRAFVVHRAVDDPRRIMLYEQYADQAAFDFHTARPEFTEIVLGQIVPLLEHRVRHLYEIVE